MGIFRSREAENIEVVRGKLEAAQTELAAQEQYLAEIALESALADSDTPAVVETQAKITGLRQRVGMLESAVAEAERLERNRLAKARADAERSRLRAMRQHLSAIEKASLDYATAAANLASAWSRMAEAQRSAWAMMTAAEQRQFGGSVDAKSLRGACRRELLRVGHPLHPVQGAPMPGIDRVGSLEWEAPQSVPALADDLKTKFSRLMTALSGGSTDA